MCNCYVLDIEFDYNGQKQQIFRRTIYSIFAKY